MIKCKNCCNENTIDTEYCTKCSTPITPDVFISYSRKDYEADNNIINLIKASLASENISFWFDEEGIYIGDEFASVITNAIRRSSVFLFVSSRNSNNSTWTSNEISVAMEFKKPIIPLRIDDSHYNDSVMMKIISLDYISYSDINKEKTIKALIRTIKHKINYQTSLKNTLHPKTKTEQTDSIKTTISGLPNASRTKSNNSKDTSTNTLDEPDKTPNQYSFIINDKEFNYPMVEIKKKSFHMGDTYRHLVTLNTYQIGKYTVNQDLWQAVMGNNPSKFKAPMNPVTNISWNDCQDFIRKLNSLTGIQFRLPTEAEWEFAARCGDPNNKKIFSGSNDINIVAWYKGNSDIIHNPGHKSPNSIGIYDLSGNVHEWCLDWYGEYTNETVSNPIGPKNGYAKVIRGGSYESVKRACEVTHRNHRNPQKKYSTIGLRLCTGELSGNHSGVEILMPPPQRSISTTKLPSPQQTSEKKLHNIINIIWRVFATAVIVAILIVIVNYGKIIGITIGAPAAVFVCRPLIMDLWKGNYDVF